MKILLFCLVLIGVFMPKSSAQSFDQALSFETKQAIITKLIYSKEAESNYFDSGEASVSEVMARDYTNYLSGTKLGLNYKNKVHLNCIPTQKAQTLLCSLTSISERYDAYGNVDSDQSFSIKAKVVFSSLSNEPSVSEIQIEIDDE